MSITPVAEQLVDTDDSQFASTIYVAFVYNFVATPPLDRNLVVLYIAPLLVRVVENPLNKCRVCLGIDANGFYFCTAKLSDVSQPHLLREIGSRPSLLQAATDFPA